MNYIVISEGSYSDYGIDSIWCRENPTSNEEIKEIKLKSIEISSDNDDRVNSIVAERLKGKNLEEEYQASAVFYYYKEKESVKIELGLDKYKPFDELMKEAGFIKLDYVEFNLDYNFD